MEFELEFTPDAWAHLQEFSVKDRKLILDAINTQLRYEPDVETRNRKPMKDNLLATWELRVGKFRVFTILIMTELKLFISLRSAIRITIIYSLVERGLIYDCKS